MKMWKQRGSATIMALTAMLVMTVGAASIAYITNRNVNMVQNYAGGFAAQNAAEAAINLISVAGQESVNKSNGWQEGDNSALEDWITPKGTEYTITLPEMGNADITVTKNSTKFKVQAVARANEVIRMAYREGMDVKDQDDFGDRKVTIASLIVGGNNWNSSSNYDWILPDDLDDTTKPSKSPGYGTTDNAWQSLTSQVMFNDSLGLPSFVATNNLQLLFRVNYYITLTDVAGSGSGSGYGVYYLAEKSKTNRGWEAGNAGNPKAYVVQFDPGLNPDFSPPRGGAWGADFSNPVNVDWPYGAFLVKKTWPDDSDGWQNEVWDESDSYQVHYAFQDNNELKQLYYRLDGGSFTLATDISDTISTKTRKTFALQDASITSGTAKPNVTRVPTVFGTDTLKYRSRPPDLRIAYSLGDIAEGNPWQEATYYPVGAKVAVGVWVDDPLDNRLVWVATQAGKSGSAKPDKLTKPAVFGDTVIDGGVVWKASKAPTAEEVANWILAKKISIAKVSMADLKARLDSVNGTSKYSNQRYNIPFAMVKGNTNKITIELWVDNHKNRVHLIRVNDVLALAFNDIYVAGKKNIVPAGWEVNRSTQLGTGLRIWNAAGEFYTAENYGQTIMRTADYSGSLWGR